MKNKEQIDLLDVTELVRSLQRREGNPDCFRQKDPCDQSDCAWRKWCQQTVRAATDDE